MLLPEDVVLKLNRFEFGYIYGAIYEHRDKMPIRLKLKLEIEAVRAYLDHPTMGEQAKKELADYEKALREITEAEGSEK